MKKDEIKQMNILASNSTSNRTYKQHDDQPKYIKAQYNRVDPLQYMKAPIVPSAGGGNMSLGKYNSGAGGGSMNLGKFNSGIKKQ